MWSPWPHERFSVRIEFRTNPPTGVGEVWDLDNLIKPTLDAMAGVFGARAWRGVPQPADDRVDHIDARKRVAQPEELPGAVIEVWAMEDEVGAPPFHRADLAARGFLGFVPLLDLDPRAVPKEAGVYAVLREMARCSRGTTPTLSGTDVERRRPSRVGSGRGCRSRRGRRRLHSPGGGGVGSSAPANSWCGAVVTEDAS